MTSLRCFFGIHRWDYSLSWWWRSPVYICGRCGEEATNLANPPR